MKKFLTAILSAVLCLITVFGSACADETQKGKVNVKYYVNGQQIVQSIMGGSETIGLVPEPAASALQANYLTQKGQALYRLDLQELYDSQDKAYPQAVLMVKKSVLGAHPELVSNLQTKITESASWIKQNVSTAVDAINDNGGTSLNKNSLNSQAIDGCKIYWESAEDSKTSVKNYINKIVEIDNTKATAVSDDFFYSSVNSSSPKNSYKFMAPDGAPALAIAKLISTNDDLGTGKSIDYSVIQATQVAPNISQAKADFIVAPVNVASMLYKANASDNYVMVAVLTHGNFYILSTTEISVKDLKGKQVAVPNQGAVPDWTFKMVLQKYDLLYTIVE